MESGHVSGTKPQSLYFFGNVCRDQADVPTFQSQTRAPFWKKWLGGRGVPVGGDVPSFWGPNQQFCVSGTPPTCLPFLRRSRDEWGHVSVIGFNRDTGPLFQVFAKVGTCLFWEPKKPTAATCPQVSVCAARAHILWSRK